MGKDTGKLSKDSEMTFWEHTEELANRFKTVLIVLVVSTVIMMVLPGNLSFFTNPLQFYDPLVGVVLRTIKAQILPTEVTLIGLEIANPIMLYVMASLFFGVAITAPVFTYQVFRFIDPALTPNERRDIYPFLLSFLGLFLTGLFFGYLILMPYLFLAILPFFSAVGAELVISVTDFYSTVFFLTLLTGLVFTFPVYLILFVKYGILQTRILTQNRKYLYAAILILVFIITPGEGGIANFMLFIPMIILLEGGIFFAKRYEKTGKIRHTRWYHEKTQCKFCKESISPNTSFCENCGKSQK